MYICEYCNKEVNIKYGSGRFCSNFCAHGYSTKNKREEINEKLKGKKHTEETKQKLSNLNKGKKLSEETKQKISNSNKGRKHTEETKQKQEQKGKKHTEETKQKLSNLNKGKKLSEETKQKIKQQAKTEKESPWWTGGFRKRNIYSYDLAYETLYRIDEIRRNEEDNEILETKCTYCGKWFVPKYNEVNRRINLLKIDEDLNKLYCSNECKKACPIYGLSTESIENRIEGKNLEHKYLSREMQPELRKIVLERDNWTCQKCFKNQDVELHCHHIYPVAIEPLESCDLDNCVTYCKECHIEAHKKDGCRYGQLRECNNEQNLLN